ncbi:MAG: small ribosomal subunit biogenesis GTPase RsgA [Gammaproteobacteria bacterium]|nr:small ribosomal subunit biogenesis GTPase RsgA [Gammaproteobacteria bacterium]MCP5137058.1 small ribosomal subunit biogenesis GTPase RsgA [Gammaproteobacteria bacterium]
MARRRLSRQQIERIKSIQEQRRERAGTRAAALEAGGLGAERHGRVITNFGKSLLVEDDDGSLVRCVPRQNLGLVVCGDTVVWQPSAQGDGVVSALNARRSVLGRPDTSGEIRPTAANLDQVVVVAAPLPEFSEDMIDRYLVAAEALRLHPLIVLNKVDLLDDVHRADVERRLATYTAIGYPVLTASTVSAHGIEALRRHMHGHISLLAGQSGVGKSSLINALLPDLGLRTQTISERSGLGQHTTTNATFYHLPDDAEGALIDSPGVRAFDLWDMDEAQIAAGFREFDRFLGHCRFHNCRHRSEPGCALKAAAEEGRIDPRRLASYLRIVDDLESGRDRLRAKPDGLA